MAFDPNADPGEFFGGATKTAAPASGGAFDPNADPDAYFGAAPAAPAAPPREGPGYVESALRGAKQGATLGFGDEIAGLLQASVSEGNPLENYRKFRDEARANDRAAQEANPKTFAAGEIGGGIASSFVPGLGVAKAGASIGAIAARGAIQGAAAGLGGSEADLTKGDVGGAARDAAFSAALGGATAGIAGKVLKGAPERLERRLLGDITEGATATQRDRLVGKAGSRVADVLDVLKSDKAIRAAGDDATKLAPAIQSAIGATGNKLDAAVAKGAPILVSDVIGKVEDVAKRLAADPGKRDLARAVAAKADDILETWGSNTHVSAQEVRTLASDIADAAFHGSPAVSPTAGKAVSRQVWGELKDLLSDSVTRGGGDATELKALNTRMSTLLNMRDAAVYRATREASPSTRLSTRLGSALDVGLAVTSPTSFVAKKALDIIGKPALKLGDRGLATLEIAARKGSTSAQLAQMGVALGLSRESGDMLGGWLAQHFGGAGTSDEAQP